MQQFVLDFPPGINHYYRTLRKGPLAGRVLISQRGREYRETVKRTIGWQHKTISERLSVTVILCPPDRRKRDIDGPIKALLDSITHAGVWVDDSQIKKLSIEMTDRIENKVEVKVEIIQ